MSNFINSIIRINILAGSSFVFMKCVFLDPLHPMEQPTFWERIIGAPLALFGMYLSAKMLLDS